MDEFEIKENQEQIEGQIPPAEDHKKVIILAVILGLLSLSYYYWRSLPKESSLSQEKLGLELVKPVEKAISNQEIIINPNNNQIKTVKPQVNAEKVNAEAVKSENSKSIKFMPVDKNTVIKAAMTGTGKSDIFQADNSGTYPENLSINPKNFKIVPPPFLKGLSNLPFINTKGSSAPAIPVESTFNINGFIGNKVIINLDGNALALGAGEKYKDIKVLKVDTNNSSAKFQKGGRIFYKNLSNSEMTEMIK